jgi:hypothetical protein
MMDVHAEDLALSPTIRLFTYKLTHDTGFAPNPFHGVCTLATCKPRIRLHKDVGDWIGGFSSQGFNRDQVGRERLVYLMRVDEKLPFETYHTDPRFAAKIPVQGSARCIDTVGDNIYGLCDAAVFQVPNRWHGPENAAKDISGHFVLISSTFAYFGSEPLVIPDEVRPRIPIGQAAHGVRTRDSDRARAFVQFAFSHRPSAMPRPTSWRTGDTTFQA